MRELKIKDRYIGDGHPCFFLAEIGINHNGNLENALKLIDLAAVAKCDGVKFQKRTPEICVPENQRSKMRETPWGYISYMEYRERIEFGEKEYSEIDAYCKQKNILWTASCWDSPSIDFIEKFDVPFHKVPSACLTDKSLLHALRKTDKPIILSTGMSTEEEIQQAIDIVGMDQLILCHCTSTYPCPTAELNLKMITTLREKYPCPIGYSGHEEGLPTTIAALVLGACFIERHITLDRAMWGSDHAASIAPIALIRLVNHLQATQRALGDGVKKVYESEKPLMQRLRRNMSR
jgi:N-acetylneuraminate synthase